MYTASKEENLKNAGQNLRAVASETAAEAKQDLRVVANKAGRRVRDFLTAANDEFDHAKDSVTTQIRTKPVQSSLIALGVGVVLGALIRR